MNILDDRREKERKKDITSNFCILQLSKPHCNPRKERAKGERRRKNRSENWLLGKKQLHDDNWFLAKII